jgi:putative oxidoreductase
MAGTSLDKPGHDGVVAAPARRRALSILIIFIARCLLVLLFLPFSALDKVLNFKEAVGQAAQATPSRFLATILILGGLGVEFFMSLAVLTGIADRLAALILAAYCVVTAVLWKQFWRTSDFRLRGESRGREMFWDFLKNLAVAGGFLMVAFGADARGVRSFFENPLGSSRPYATSDEKTFAAHSRPVVSSGDVAASRWVLP